MNLWGHLFSQNASQKLPRFLPYPLINVQGRNLGNFWLAFWEKRWPQKFILNSTDLYTEHWNGFLVEIFWKRKYHTHCLSLIQSYIIGIVLMSSNLKWRAYFPTLALALIEGGQVITYYIFDACLCSSFIIISWMNAF